MMCQELFQKIQELEQAYLSVWEDVTNIESPTADKAGVDAVGQYLEKMALERGWKVERSVQDVSGDVLCITMNPDSKEAPISISGHIDTVHPVGSFGYPAVRKDAKKIYGPGITDCKGGVVAGFLAMDALSQCGFDKRPVQLLLQTDEEGSSMQSGKSTIRYICEKSRGSVAFLNLESHTRNKTTLSRKGIASYRFNITGRAGHSARCATEGANAVVDAAFKIVELDRLKDDRGVTCNCAIVHGGTVVNTIPDQCTFSVNFRFATYAQATMIDSYVKKLAATEHVPGCRCEVEKISERVAMELHPRNKALLAKVNEIYEENGLPVLEAASLPGGSDAADVSFSGVPCLDSLGTTGGNSHSVNEFAWIASLTESARRIAAVVYCI